MFYVFVICATIGGTVLVFQFVLTMIGLGGEAFDLDMPDGDADVDLDFDADVDTGSDMDAGHDGHVGSSWLFGVISFRTMVAAVAFFGLAGLTAQSAEASPAATLLTAVAAGAAAMYGVYWIMRGLNSLNSEGTPRISQAVNRYGTVYTTIPANKGGSGKIQINVRNQTMEYLAMTSGEKLSPGSKVVVVDVITPTTVAVEPALESDTNPDA
jgi:membrane protein implicated in regulation of membrane protease activity